MEKTVAIIGLGYVGLPLAVAFGKAGWQVVGFDSNEKRIHELETGEERTGEVTKGDLEMAKLSLSSDPSTIRQAKFVIVAVPTPIDDAKKPDLTMIESASKTVGQNMAVGAVVIFESTVYPGLTEEVCVPIIERESGRKCGTDWNIGYSPERINPGDKTHTIDKVIKVVAGDTRETLEQVAGLYEVICKAGVHRASSIRVAEAAKVIENTQRDLNIALMNELSLIFHRMGIDTREVLAAAGTKWNFLPFYPGLVGGHCIGVDPYYLTHKATALGYHPQVILAGRRVNDDMGNWIVSEMIKEVVRMGKKPQELKVLICGLTFKENVPDLRNSRVEDLVTELGRYGIIPILHDPLADPRVVEDIYHQKLAKLDEVRDIDVIVFAVSHRDYRQMTVSDVSRLLAKNNPLLVDVHAMFSESFAKEVSASYWRL